MGGFETQIIGGVGYGCSGRGGNESHMSKAKSIQAEHGGGMHFPSDNHHRLSAALDALCATGPNDSRWKIPSECLTVSRGGAVPVPGAQPPRSAGPGLGEQGPCYDPNGNMPCNLILSYCAKLDGRNDADEWAAENAGMLALYAALTHRTRPATLDGYLSGKLIRQDRPIQTKGEWFMVSGGPRAAFYSAGSADGWGWDLESPATQWVQWILGANGRRLGSRYASYSWGQNSWDWGFRSVEALTRSSFTETFPHWFLTAPETADLRAYIESHGIEGADTVTRLSRGHMRKYGIDVIRLRNGDMHCVYSHGTSGPKPPVTWVHHSGSHVRLTMPNDYVSNAQGDGRGEVEIEGGLFRIAAWSDRDGHRFESPWISRDDVVSHLSMGPRSLEGLQRGKLDPGSSSGGGSSPVVAMLKSKRLAPNSFRLTNKSTGSGGAPPDELWIGDELKDKPFQPGERVEVTLEPGEHEAKLLARAGDLEETDTRLLVVANPEPDPDPDPEPDPDPSRSWWQRFLDWLRGLF